MHKANIRILIAFAVLHMHLIHTSDPLICDEKGQLLWINLFLLGVWSRYAARSNAKYVHCREIPASYSVHEWDNICIN